MQSSILLATAGTLCLLAIIPATVFAAGDPVAGEKVFAKCKACHTAEPGGRNLVGPNLHGVVGRKGAAVQGFTYSQSLTALGVTWDEASLAAYLADPRKFNPGTKMVFAGLKKQQEIDDVIAFLKAAP